MTNSGNNDLESSLFPSGTEFSDSARSQILEIYKLFVRTSEDLVARRQTVNAFFITVNTLLLSSVGLVAKLGFGNKFNIAGILALSSAGLIVCYAWIRLVDSFRQLNSGKFKVINRLEAHLPASVFEAEWRALGQGRDPKLYQPFTATEPMIALVFGCLYVVASAYAIFVLANVIHT